MTYKQQTSPEPSAQQPPFRFALVLLSLAFGIPFLVLGQEPTEGWLGPAPMQQRWQRVLTPEVALTGPNLSVDTQSRSAVATFFDNHYAPNLAIPIAWTGSITGCLSGSTSQAYIDATIDMINYYRAMVALPSVTNQSSANPGGQDAALMMIAEAALSHSPPMTWACYTASGASAAGSSNLALGNAGPAAMVAYIRDSGNLNAPVGHRRWLLYPPRAQMGTGSNDGVNVFFGANALNVFGPTTTRPANPVAISWPPEGFVPYQVVYPRWSFSLNSNPGANYASAIVTMAVGSTPVPLNIVSTNAGFGDQTIVWEPSSLSFGAGMEDTTISVTVDNIGSSSVTSYSYQVKIIDPAVTPSEIFADGFEAGTTSAWTSSL